jgi:hypothetical protein
MKTVLKALGGISIFAIIIGLLASGTVDIRPILGATAKQFNDSRQMLQAEDFGVGAYLGGSFDGAISTLGTPGESTEFGTYRSAAYYLPFGEPGAGPSNNDGKLVIKSDEDVITDVSLELGQSHYGVSPGVSFGGVSADGLEPSDLIRELGRPAARMVLLGNKVYAWYIIPPLRHNKAENAGFRGSAAVTAKFDSNSGRLNLLNVRVSK